MTRRLSLRAVLSLVLGGLVLATAVVVMLITVAAGGDAAFGDAIDKGVQAQRVVSERVAAELRAVQAAEALLSRLPPGERGAVVERIAALAPVAQVVASDAPEGWSSSDGRLVYRSGGSSQALAVDPERLEAVMTSVMQEGVAGVLLVNGRVVMRTRSGGRVDEATDATLEALFATPRDPEGVIEDAPTLRRVEREDDEPVLFSSEPVTLGGGRSAGLDLRAGFATTPSTVGQALGQVFFAGIAAAVFALLAVAFALWIAKRIAARITGLRDALHDIAALDLDGVEPGPPLPARELEDIRHALEAAVSSLRAFSLFVPIALVQRLLDRSNGTLRLAEEREVTVMFTDIVGFTQLASSMTPGEVTAVLDRHFETVAAAVEAEGGTVDKFIGDGVLAYWGAPEPTADHAARALRAAARIQKVHAEAAHGEGADARFGLRIGLHSGPVVAGTVGTGERLDYTVVGDTVNVASRLEQLGREVDPDCSCCALASGEVVARAGDGACHPLGPRALRGRAGEVEVFRLPAATDLEAVAKPARLADQAPVSKA